MKAFQTIIVLAALVFSMISCYKDCGKGWRRHNNKCYLPSNNLALDWFGALNFCRSIGGGLAVPKNVKEHDFLKMIAQNRDKQSVWIGIADVITDGRWITYPDIMYPTYLNWDSREPNGKTGENCVVMAKKYGYKWNDTNCSAVRKFICEKAR